MFNDDKTEENYIFGVANVNLSELANNKSIHGLFDIIVNIHYCIIMVNNHLIYINSLFIYIILIIKG